MHAFVMLLIKGILLTYLLAQTFFPSAVRLWNTLPVEICQLCPDHFKSHLNSIHFS